jgi:hypothetical protein
MSETVTLYAALMVTAAVIVACSTNSNVTRENAPTGAYDLAADSLDTTANIIDGIF